jgi:hypothetical protein
MINVLGESRKPTEVDIDTNYVLICHFVTCQLLRLGKDVEFQQRGELMIENLE